MAKLLLNEKLDPRYPYVLVTPSGEKYPVGSETLAENVCRIKKWDLTKETN
jgi:hypothetical protein